MQQTLEPRSETLLGKWLAGIATAAETDELRSAASGDEELRQAMELVEQSFDCVRHSAIGEATMIDSSLPPFTRPERLAETLRQLHAARRRLLVLSLGALVSIFIAVAWISGPAALWDPNTLSSMFVAGIILAALTFYLRREDPVCQLSRLESLEGGESWLAQVQDIERSRKRYASRGARSWRRPLYGLLGPKVLELG